MLKGDLPLQKKKIYISEFEDIATETIPCEHRKKNRSDLNYWE